MMAGLPGTGIGGFFYLLTTLWMPFRETGRALRGQSSRERWSVVGLQGALALGAIASIWMTGWLLALVIPPAWINDHANVLRTNILRIAPIILQAAVLGAVFVGVHVLRLLTRPRRLRCVVLVAWSCLGLPLGAVALAEDRPPALHLPSGYDFSTSIEQEVGSYEDFYQRYVRSLVKSGPENAYGLALANLALGIAGSDPVPIVTAKALFAAHARISSDPREQRLAGLGARYAESLLSGRYAQGAGVEGTPATVEIRKDPPPAGGFQRIILGRSAIRVKRHARIKTQVDRVTRDWVLSFNVKSAPWMFARDEAATWHEGRRLGEIVDLTGAEVIPVWGTTARKYGEKWFAPDADGIFRFEVSEDKVNNYPTTIVVDERTAIINDTHGVSAIAWDALDADLVVACGDHPGKMQAAYYLADRGVDVYTPTDRVMGMLIGARTKGVIVGSAPVKKSADGAVIGDQPIAIEADEPIVVSTTQGRYPLQYYDTAYRYFKALEAYASRPLKITPVEVTEYGKAEIVVDAARRIGAKVIGMRVRSRTEHDAVYEWLKEDGSRRAVLFHTAAYPEGYKLFFEFPRQTSFGDIHPVFE